MLQICFRAIKFLCVLESRRISSLLSPGSTQSVSKSIACSVLTQSLPIQSSLILSWQDQQDKQHGRKIDHSLTHLPCQPIIVVTQHFLHAHSLTYPVHTPCFALARLSLLARWINYYSPLKEHRTKQKQCTFRNIIFVICTICMYFQRYRQGSVTALNSEGLCQSAS